MELYKNNFSNNLRLYRVKAGYKQAELAEKIGMTRQNYMRYENESIQAQPTIELLCKLADILNTDVNTLVGYKANIDLETAYKMFDVTVRKNEIDFIYNITLDAHDEMGFDNEPRKRKITITLPIQEFNKTLKEDYQIAYNHVTNMRKNSIDEYFTSLVKNDMYYRFLKSLLDKINKE